MGWSKDHGTIAKVNADYAKEQANVAKQEATNLAELKTNVEAATQNASTAAENANAVIEDANLAASNADSAASEAIAQANHAKNEGDRAKAEADRLAGTDVSVLDNKVTNLSDSVNTKFGEVTTQLAQIAVDIEKFGAVDIATNPSFDSADSIQNALYFARDNGLSTILIPNKQYYISKPITVPSDTTINTQNGVLLGMPNLGWAIGSRRAMLEVIDSSNVKINNLTLDGNVMNLTETQSIITGMLVMNSKNGLFNNMKFRNIGARTGSSSSGLLRIIGRDDINDFSEELAAVHQSVIGPIEHVDFLNCEFTNPGAISSSFAVRVLTDWLALRTRETVENKVSDIKFIGCKSIGSFQWNHFEFAGSGTVENIVRNCYFTGNSLSAIDFDKGASFNTAEGNLIESVALPDVLFNNNTVVLGVINIHGITGLPGDGNKAINNRIFNSDNPTTRTHSENAAAIGISDGNFNVIEGNFIDNVNNGVNGSGITIGSNANNTNIIRNVMRNVRWGIRTNPSAERYDNNSIENNKIQSNYQGIVYGSGSQQVTVKGLSIIGNLIENAGSNSTIQSTSMVLSPLIKGNQIVGGFEGIRSTSPGALIDGNIIKDVTSRSLRVDNALGSNKSIVVNNVSINPSISDLIFPNERPYVNNNIFNRTIENGGYIGYSSTAPTTGTWKVGDRVYNTNPLPNRYNGWICVTGGTPGTWKGFGLIEG